MLSTFDPHLIFGPRSHKPKHLNLYLTLAFVFAIHTRTVSMRSFADLSFMALTDTSRPASALSSLVIIGHDYRNVPSSSLSPSLSARPSQAATAPLDHRPVARPRKSAFANRLKVGGHCNDEPRPQCFSSLQPFWHEKPPVGASRCL